MCGAIDCRSCGPAQGYRGINVSIDKIELHRRVEQAIDDEIMGETSEYREVIAEMWSLEELPLHLRSRYYNSVTYADAMLRAAWKGNTEAITTLGQLLETAIRDWLAKQLTAKIRKEMEDEL
jgi:hypothetical protein